MINALGLLRSGGHGRGCRRCPDAMLKAANVRLLSHGIDPKTG